MVITSSRYGRGATGKVY